MINPIPFSIPEKFLAGIADGSLIRIGTILKDRATGQIVAHVQETGVSQLILENIGNIPFTPFDGLNLASSALTNIQLKNISNMLETMKLFQYANLGVTLAGIGVSVIGFTILNKKIKNLESQISTLKDSIDVQFNEIYKRKLREHYSKVYTLIEKADLAYTLTNANDEWRQVASALADESGYFKGELIHHLNESNFNQNFFTSLLSSFSACNTARMQCYLLSEELNAAHSFAISNGKTHEQLFDNIQAENLAIKSLSNTGKWNKSRFQSLQSKAKKFTPLVQGIREITDSALTQPYLIENLINQGISGKNYITALNKEEKQPILLLNQHSS